MTLFTEKLKLASRAGETKTPPAIQTDGGSVFLNHETNHLSASATNWTTDL